MSLKLELVDRPCAFWDVTTAEWVPTHQRMCTNHIMSYLWAAALIYTSVVCLFWRTVKGESRPPHRHCVVFLCATPDSSGFRVARSGKEEGKSWLYQGMGEKIKKQQQKTPNAKSFLRPQHGPVNKTKTKKMKKRKPLLATTLQVSGHHIIWMGVLAGQYIECPLPWLVFNSVLRNCTPNLLHQRWGAGLNAWKKTPTSHTNCKSYF